MRNSIISDNNLVPQAVRILATWFPRGWRLAKAKQGKASNRQADALFKLRAPDGTTTTIVLEAKRSVDPKDVWALAGQMKAYQAMSSAIPVIVAPFLSPRTRDRLREAGLSYLDLAGNAHVIADRPAILIELNGLEKNPLREERRAGSLKGKKAGRIVRYLCDFLGPIGIRALARKTGTDPGYVSRVLFLLDREALIKREARGPVTDTDWQGLIRRWAEDYSPLEDKSKVKTYLEPRGLSALLEKLKEKSFRYSMSGSLAASRVAPIAPPQLALCYVDDPALVAGDLELRPAEVGGNVILAEPFDPVVYERTWKREGITFAALSQTAVDLLTSPGRSPSEGDALITWMKEHEHEWRH